MATKRQTHVRWDEDEWFNLSKRTYELFIKDPSRSIIQCCNEAQEKALHMARRRHIASSNQIEPVIEYIKEQFQGMGHRQDLLMRLRRQEDTIRALEDLLEECESNNDKELDLSKIPFPDLMAEYTRRMAVQYENLQRALDSLNPSKPIKTKSSPKVRKPKVMIFGLLPNQYRIINEHLDDQYYVRYLEAKDGVVISGEYDLYILMANFVSHCHQDKIKESANGNLIIHKGGISAVPKLIKNYFNGTPS